MHGHNIFIDFCICFLLGIKSCILTNTVLMKYTEQVSAELEMQDIKYGSIL